MSATNITSEQLSAYVDGELTAAEAAEVARAMADDRRVAEQVAQLSRLKAVLPSAAEPLTVALPKAPLASRSFGLAALAAAVVLFVVTGGARLGPVRRCGWRAAVGSLDRADATGRTGPSLAPARGLGLRQGG